MQPHAAYSPPHISSDLPAKYAQLAREKPNAYLITNVSVIPMTSDTILDNLNVLIEDGRISRFESASALDTSSHPFIIDGSGKFLIPGLSDMHIHIYDDNDLLLFIANGITTVRNMAGFELHLQMRGKIRNEEILGPRFYTTGPILEGVKPVWPSSTVVTNEKQARNAVIKCREDGYDFVKAYHTLSGSVYREILRVADSIGIPVVGHIPFDVELSESLAGSQYSLEHIDLRPVGRDIPLERKEEMVAASGKWICPTLVVLRNIQRSPELIPTRKEYSRYVDAHRISIWNRRAHQWADAYEQQKQMAEAVYRLGGRLITGTDCLNSWVLAGFSIHEELQQMVNAGIPEFEVLKASTVNAAEFLRRQQESGTIERGKVADLILLDGNPLADISNTKKIRGVMVRGKWFDRVELDSMLADVVSFRHVK